MIISKESLFVDNATNQFKTHLVYIKVILNELKNVNFDVAGNLLVKKNDLALLKQKRQLIKLTMKSIDDEFEIVKISQEYSLASVLWLPIKSYYLLYHLLTVLDFLMTGRGSSLSKSHNKIIKVFNKLLSSKKLSFSNKNLDRIFNSSILDFKSKSGEHLKNDIDNDSVYKLIMKKIAKDKMNEFKRKRSLNLRKKKDNDIYKKEKEKLEISIFDYFYLMRLRSNYRNSDFIDSVNSKHTKEYFTSYYHSISKLYKILSNFINLKIKEVEKHS